MLLQVNNVKYEDQGQEILKGVSFEVEKGDCLSIVGESGSGKSTLLRLCADLITPTKGEIFYEGKTYKDYEPTHLRKCISYCVQTPILFGERVEDNLAFPFQIRHKKIDEKLVMDLMESLNLEATYLHKRIEDLSGGEKQRIAFIRNILFKPDILLLDEVTASLDPINTQWIEKCVTQLHAQGMTVIWVTHDLEQSQRLFNKRLTMCAGQVEKVEVLKK